MEEVIVTEEQKQLEKYSYSKISTYKSCGFKFLLKYKEKNFIDSSSIATDFGSLVHSIEESIAIAIRDKLAINYVALKNKFIVECRKIAIKYPNDFFKQDKSGRTYRDKMYLYLESAIYRLENFMKTNPDLEIIGIEQKFEYDYDGEHSFNGSIDRAFLNKNTGEILIQDIKTWSVLAQASELKAPLQFAVYMMAAEKLWEVPFEKIKCEYDLPLCNTIQPALSDNIVEEGKAALDKLFKGIQNENFKPSPSPLCYFCEYCPSNPSYAGEGKVLCPYHSLWTRENSTRETAVKWMGLEFHSTALKQYKDLFLRPNTQT